MVDGFTDEASIAQLFALKYRSLYSSVPYDASEMQGILAELDSKICDGGLSRFDHVFNSADVKDANDKLNLHKNDGSCALSTDHLLRAGPDLSVYIAFLFSCMVTHGTAPNDFSVSTIILIP